MRGTNIIFWTATIVVVVILTAGAWQSLRWVFLCLREWREKRQDCRWRRPDWTYKGLVPGTRSARKREDYLRRLDDWMRKNRTGTVVSDASDPYEEIQPDAPAPPRP